MSAILEQKGGSVPRILAQAALSFFYPPKCAVCKVVGYGELCPRCREHLDEVFSPGRFLANGGNAFADQMFSLFPYGDEAVQSLLFDWKQENYKDLHDIFSFYLEKAVKKGLLPENIHLVSYLPRRKSARRKAGFDQAQEIAGEVARILDVPMETLLLRRGRSKPQRKAAFRDREKNVRGVFLPTRSFAGENILLVDDIITTGSTAKEGARVLKSSGAMKVYVLSLAH